MPKTEHLARCVICGRMADGDKDFICENCGHPEKIMLHCGGCRTSRDIDISELYRIVALAGFDMPIRKGMSVLTSCCVHEDDKKKISPRVNIKFWSVGW